jgi:hypothetical protein
LQRARTLAPTAEDRARIAAMEAWILLLRGISNDPAALSHGRLLADSAMQLVAHAVFVPTTVAAVGAVLGKWEVSDRIAPSARSTSFASGAATNEIVELLWRAALREAPTDSLRLLDAGVRAIGAKDQSTDATRLLAGMYGRSLAIAFPRYTSPAIATARGTNDYLLRMQAALREGDSTAVRAELARLVLERAQGPTAARLEALLPEARLWFALGDAPRAAAWLDARLSALAVDAETPTVAAGAVLRQTVRFRGELARHLRDDTGQRRWRAVATAIRLEAKEP